MLLIMRTRSVQGPFEFTQDELCWHTVWPKNLENFQQNLQHGEFRILPDLDSPSKVEVGPPPPSPTRHREICFLADLDSQSKVGKVTYPPPPPTGHRKIWFSQIWTQDQKLER